MHLDVDATITIDHSDSNESQPAKRTPADLVIPNRHNHPYRPVGAGLYVGKLRSNQMSTLGRNKLLKEDWALDHPGRMIKITVNLAPCLSEVAHRELGTHNKLPTETALEQ